ncbi:MAG: hypothetical protein M1352_01970 [Patescibacteria group bacterium]|nr:hypothetical protein [Patescibacteria group bacterium]
MDNPVISVLIFFTLGALLLSVLFYRLSFSERMLFKGRLPILQFLLGVVAPPIMLLPVFQLYRLIERNPLVSSLPISDEAYLFFIFCLVALGSVGNGMHVAGLSIDYKAQNLDGLEEDEKALIRVVDFFHHGFSHLMVYLPLELATFVFLMFELNHPGVVFMNIFQVISIGLAGTVFGLACGLSVIEGSGYRVIIPLNVVLVLAAASLVIRTNVSIFLLPTAFYMSTSYITGFLVLVSWGLYHRGFPEIMGELKIKEGHPKSPRAKENE